MHPIEAFVRNPVKVSVGVLLVTLFGVIALLRMPMQLTPEVQIPTITIQTRWPGASPQEVEREIIQEQEEQLKGVENALKLSSESLDSLGRITIEFRVGSDIGKAVSLVSRRLQQVPEYPEEADEPVISTSNSSDRAIAWFILSARMPRPAEIAAFQKQHPKLAELLEPARRAHSPGLAVLRLRMLAKKHPEIKPLLPPDIDVPKRRKFAEDEIEARFERVSGVSNSNVFGGQDPELQVVVDPQLLAARQLTVADLREALRGQNKDTSAGDFWEGKRRWVVRTLGQYRSPKQVEEQIIAIRDGAPVYIRDVAQVRLGHKKPDGLVRRFGSASIAINAQRETGANVLKVMQGLRKANQELNEDILRDLGLELTQVYDETDYINSAVYLVNQNIVIGGLLTIGILLLFLRSGRSTLVIGLAIPTSIVGTFVMLNLLNRSLNVISLAGLAFAVGMLVDNAVVVLENIHRHWQKGARPFSAAVTATKEVWGAVIASTLTTLAVFLPVLFVQEEAGQLFRDIALAISSAVGLSLLVSVTVIPTAAARLLGRRKEGPPTSERPLVLAADSYPAGDNGGPRPSETRGLGQGVLGRIDRISRSFVDLVVGLNAWAQRGLTRRLAIVGGLVGASVLFSFLLWPKVEYLPTGNRNLVFGIILPPPGYNLDEMMQIGETVEAELRPYWDIDPGSEQTKKLDYPPIGDFFYVARGRQVFLGLRAVDPLQAAALVPLVRQVGAKLEGVYVIANQSSLFERGLSAGRTIDIEITGPELTHLVGLGGQMMRKLMDPTKPLIPNAQARPIPSLDLSSPEVHVQRKSIPAAEMGVSATDLGYTVNALIDGAYATDYYIGGDKIDLTIIGQKQYASRTQDIESLPIATPSGQLVPLSSLADVKLASGPEQINHRERQRAITIQVRPPPEVALEEAIQRIEQELIGPLRKSGQLDGGYRITLSGTADKLRNTWLALRWNFLLALLITYLLMAALFESWLYPLVIIISVLLGIVGGLGGLKLLGWYLDPVGHWNWYLGLSEQLPRAQPLDVLTMLGFVILVGTAVNNAILIVHQALNHMRSEDMPPRQAILESVRTRIRPIFMTTATTVFGLSPLVFYPGAGSELYRGLGSVVLGGLLVSSIFTLVLVPTLFSLMMDMRESLFGQEGLSAPRPVAVAEQAPSSFPLAK